ncbi:hypothetical protein BST17_20710 [Mycolicibacterium bacteremicum]|uniref:Uncharacterized protein n=1 Tax=Mycolicibacterium bacteremicum TaxID=564198 RepID=A0A1W9YSK1_MYCBA|nr:hypothetical protein BST17_20710 [Mycolicibacterium bacteremicum]
MWHWAAVFAVVCRQAAFIGAQRLPHLSDRNWQVCTSTPAPGGTFTASTEIDFGVVRIDTEECP